MKEKLRKITLVAMLTALAIVLSTWLKVPLISDIKLDLSYIVLTIAIIYCDVWGAMFVGVMTALLGSLLFSAYGLSYSWILANLTIVLIASPIFKLCKGHWWSIYVFAIGIIIAVAVGMLVVKTGVECYLYNIPLVVKLPKNFAAFMSDSLCMLLGLPIYKLLPKRV